VYDASTHKPLKTTGEIMDFGKMTDQLKEQASEKVKEELLQKVDEVKAEVEKKFGSFGGTKEPGPVEGTNDAQSDRSASPEGGSQPEGQSTTEESVDQNADDSTSATVDTETDQQSDDDTSEKVA